MTNADKLPTFKSVVYKYQKSGGVQEALGKLTTLYNDNDVNPGKPDEIAQFAKNVYVKLHTQNCGYLGNGRLNAECFPIRWDA